MIAATAAISGRLMRREERLTRTSVFSIELDLKFQISDFKLATRPSYLTFNTT
jgi:hypothetical protein